MRAWVAGLAITVVVGCGGGGKASSPTTVASTTTEDPHTKLASEIDAAGLRHGYTDAELSEIADAICKASDATAVMGQGFNVENGWTSTRVYTPSHGGFNIPGSEVAKMILVFGRVVCPQNSATLSMGADQLANSHL